MSPDLDDVGTVLVLIGALVFAIGALGLLRLPDLYSRLSAVTIAGGPGVVLILIGVLLHHPSPANAGKVALAIAIQLATAAVGGSAMARAGYLTHAPRAAATFRDDLAVAPAIGEETAAGEEILAGAPSTAEGSVTEDGATGDARHPDGARAEPELPDPSPRTE